MYNKECCKYYYRWLVVNNQNTCFTEIVELIEGYFSTDQDVIEYLEDEYNFKEKLYKVLKIEESEVEAWQIGF